MAGTTDGRRRPAPGARPDTAAAAQALAKMPEPFTWPAPASLVADGRRWPQADAFTTQDPRLTQGVTWLQDLSATVRTERFARRMSREDLATAAGVSYNAIKDLELGLRWPSWQTLTSCLAVLDLSVAVERAQPEDDAAASRPQAGTARGPRSSR